MSLRDETKKLLEEPMAKRDTRQFSEDIVNMFKQQSLSPLEQIEVLKKAKEYMLNEYSDLAKQAEEQLKIQTDNINTLERPI